MEPCGCSSCAQRDEELATRRMEAYRGLIAQETPDAASRVIEVEHGWNLDTIWGLAPEADSDEVLLKGVTVAAYNVAQGFSCEHEPRGGCLACYASSHADEYDADHPLRLERGALWTAPPKEEEA